MKCTFAILSVMLLALPIGANQRPAYGTTFRLGPEALVSINQDGGQLRCEPSAAIFGDTIIVAWNDSYGGIHGSTTGVAVGWAISKDRGKTFQFGGYLPDGRPGTPPSGADSWLMADKDGNFYLQVLSWQKQSHHIHLYYMDHQSLGRWQRMADAVVYDQKNTGSSFLLDKPAMWVENGRIAIAYTEEQNNSGSTISLVLSSDRGKSWKKPMQLSSKSKKLKTGACVTMDRRRIIASWMEAENEIWYVASEDEGESFSAPAMIYKLKEPLRPPKGYAMGVGPAAFIGNNTWLTGIPKTGSASTFYLACVEGAGQSSDGLLFTLPPGAEKWSGPVRVGDDGKGSIKIFPSLANAGARPALLYYYRAGTSNTLTDVHLSIMSESGRFETIKVNTASSDWSKVPGDKQNAPIQRNFGDYITLASDGNSLLATWTDGRNGVPGIYARVIEIR